MFLLVQATSHLMYERCETCRTYTPLNGNDRSIIKDMALPRAIIIQNKYI